MSETEQDQGRPKGEIKLRLFGKTDVGQIREHNEDNFLIADLTRDSQALREEDREVSLGESGMVFAVCDGMGGAAAGEVASQKAVDILYDQLNRDDAPRSRNMLARRLVEAIEDAGLFIFNEARSDRNLRGMGTTATVAAMIDERLFLGQVGDSRAYVLRGDQLVQVTRDQSLVNQLIEAGQLTEEEAETFEHNNIILQALGTADAVQVDLTYVDLRRGDTLLMCSDGLSGMIRAEELRDVLLRFDDPLDACKELTDRANDAGGHDNITVLVIKFDGAGLALPGKGDDLSYKKYALPEPEEEEGERRSRSSTSANVKPGPLSEEAERESRSLRVSHTIIGEVNPLLGSDGKLDAAFSTPEPAPSPLP